MYIVFILQIYQVVRKAEFRLVLWCIQIWETELGKQIVPGNPVPRIEHFSRPDDGDKIKGALFLQRSVADAIKRLGPCPCSTVSGLVGNFLVHIMAGRGRVCWRSTASFSRCGKFLEISSMSEVYEQSGELVKGFVFDAGRLGVVRDVEMLNPIWGFFVPGGWGGLPPQFTHISGSVWVKGPIFYGVDLSMTYRKKSDGGEVYYGPLPPPDK